MHTLNIHRRGRKVGHVTFSQSPRNRRWYWTLWARGHKVASCAEGDGFPSLSKVKRNFAAARRLLVAA